MPSIRELTNYGPPDPNLNKYQRDFLANTLHTTEPLVPKTTIPILPKMDQIVPFPIPPVVLPKKDQIVPPVVLPNQPPPTAATPIVPVIDVNYPMSNYFNIPIRTGPPPVQWEDAPVWTPPEPKPTPLEPESQSYSQPIDSSIYMIAGGILIIAFIMFKK